MTLTNDLRKLQEIFEGVDPASVETLKAMARELKIARMKDKFRDNHVAKMIMVEIDHQIELCNKILLTDKGLDRDPIIDKMYRTRVYERLDNMKMVLGLFGNADEYKEIKKIIKRNVKKNEEFIK